MRRSVMPRTVPSRPRRFGGMAVAAALAIAVPGAAAAETAATAFDLPAGIDATLPELALDPSQISVYARRVDDDAPRLAVAADRPRVPASVMKLVTSIAALDLLGPTHRWHTEVHRTGDLRDGLLIGDLIVKGYGDPYISNDAFAGLIRALRAKGIGTIAGDLVFDLSQLAPPDEERGDFDGGAERAYNALPSALSVNRQVTDLVVYHDTPSGRVGIYTDPPLSGVDLVNEATVVQAPCKGRFHRLRVTFSEPEGARPRLEVGGTFASECPDEHVPRLILSPEQHAAGAFHALWRQQGGRIEGRVRLGERPADAVLIHSAESPPLAELLRDLNKLSNNLMARLVFLTLGTEAGGAPGTPEKARAVVDEWLAGIGVDTRGLFIDNGSGLSRDSRLSARTLGELLVYAWRQPWMPELLASLPIAGVDGTMARRLRYEPIEGRAHVKTGTLRNASCIAGYVLDKDGRRWVVVVLVNAIEGQTLQAWRGHAVHHAVLRWVYDGAPADPAP
jgi:D-alanyl-D-alanine carboxypeptidase/D-alanyl-D-alanine-endopeptidase (penicillin-binding protein 4)